MSHPDLIDAQIHGWSLMNDTIYNMCNFRSHVSQIKKTFNPPLIFLTGILNDRSLILGLMSARFNYLDIDICLESVIT